MNFRSEFGHSGPHSRFASAPTYERATDLLDGHFRAEYRIVGEHRRFDYALVIFNDENIFF